MSWPADGLPRFKLVETTALFLILDRAFCHRPVAIFDRTGRGDHRGLAVKKLAELSAKA